MPVSDIGRKGRRVDKDIPLLLQRRDSRCWHTFGAETPRTWLHTSMSYAFYSLTAHRLQ
jgi:hypothetical protein